ncbi:hypothetical protein D3C81_09970 [compost metagenome]
MKKGLIKNLLFGTLKTKIVALSVVFVLVGGIIVLSVKFYVTRTNKNITNTVDIELSLKDNQFDSEESAELIDVVGQEIKSEHGAISSSNIENTSNGQKKGDIKQVDLENRLSFMKDYKDTDIPKARDNPSESSSSLIENPQVKDKSKNQDEWLDSEVSKVFSYLKRGYTNNYDKTSSSVTMTKDAFDKANDVMDSFVKGSITNSDAKNTISSIEFKIADNAAISRFTDVTIDKVVLDGKVDATVMVTYITPGTHYLYCKSFYSGVNAKTTIWWGTAKKS